MAKPNNHNPLTKTSQTIVRICEYAKTIMDFEQYKAYCEELDELLGSILVKEWMVLHVGDEEGLRGTDR
jgi:hypothetical protein